MLLPSSPVPAAPADALEVEVRVRLVRRADRVPPKRNGDEVPPQEAAMRSGIASCRAPKTMSVMRGLVSVLPPATGAGKRQLTIVPGGAMIVKGR